MSCEIQKKIEKLKSTFLDEIFEDVKLTALNKDKG